MISVQLGSYTPSSNKAEYIDITLGIFFDGTKNNKTNTSEREKNTSAFKKNGADDDESSYYNDWTNVARLWDQYDKNCSLYVARIGNKDQEERYFSPKDYFIKVYKVQNNINNYGRKC